MTRSGWGEGEETENGKGGRGRKPEEGEKEGDNFFVFARAFPSILPLSLFSLSSLLSSPLSLFSLSCDAVVTQRQRRRGRGRREMGKRM